MLEIKNTVIEMKNAFDGLIRIMLWAEEIINDLEDMLIEISQTAKKKDWKKNNVQEVWDKNCNVHIMAIAKKKEQKKYSKLLTAEKFPKLLINTKPQIQEAHRILSRLNI